LKRKLALLLAVVFLLSAVPLQAFGATGIGRGNVVASLPANTRATVYIDLAELVAFYSTGEKYVIGSLFKGYPIDVTLDKAVFNFDTSLNTPLANHIDFSGKDAMAASNLNNWDNLLKSLVALNMEMGSWYSAADNDTGPAIAATIDFVALDYTMTLGLLGHNSSFTSAAGLNAILGSDSITAQPWYAEAKADIAGPLSDVPIGSLPPTTDANGVPFAGYKGTQLSKLREWLKTGVYADTVSPAPQNWIFTWNVQIVANNRLRFHIQALRQMEDGTYMLDRIPADILQSGRMILPIHLPIYFPNEDSWDATIRVTDGITGLSFLEENVLAANFIKPDVNISTGLTTSSFDLTGKINEFSITEQIAGYLSGDIAGQGEKLAVELRASSPYAQLINDPQDQIRFRDVQSTFHYSPSANYNTLDYFGPQTPLAVDYNIGIKQGSRTAGATAYDIQLTLPNDPAGNPAGEGMNGRYNLDLTRFLSDTLKVSNLSLTFDERQPYNEAVELEYRLIGVKADGTYGETIADWRKAGPIAVRRAGTTAPVSDSLEEILSGAENGASSEAILDALESLGLADYEDELTDPENVNIISEIEQIYNTASNISVNVTVDNNTHGNFQNQQERISVVGAGLNAQPGETVALRFLKPVVDKTIDSSKYLTNNAVQVDIDLYKGEVPVSLVTPILITVPIPSGINEQNFRILHFLTNGDMQVITPRVNGDGTCTFAVSSFSVFAFVNEIAPPVVTPPYVPPYYPPYTPVSTPAPAAPSPINTVAAAPVVRPYKVSVIRDKESPTVAVIDVNVKPTAGGTVSLNVSNAMIQAALQNARSVIRSKQKAGLTESLMLEVSALPVSDVDVKAASVRIDNASLKKIDAAGVGLVINTPVSRIVLDNEAVLSLLEQNAAFVTFTVKPLSKPTFALQKIADGHPIYNVTCLVGGRRLSGAAAGKVKYGIAYELAAGESEDGLSLLAIERSRGIPVEGSVYADGMITWSGDANGMFTVTHQGELPPE
jgi:hypothetical protein